MRCSLENQPTRYIYYILNKLNGTSLNVGSECINYFWKGDLAGKTIAQLKKEGKKLKLLSKLNDNIPGIARLIDEWDSLIRECEVILPLEIEEPYLKLKGQAKQLLADYLEEKVDDNCFELFKNILAERDNYIQKINQYVQKNLHKRYIPKKTIRTWLEVGRDHETLNWLKEDGFITWRSARRIKEPIFMGSIVPDLNNKLVEIGLKIIEVIPEEQGYVLENLSRIKIQLFSEHEKLILYCGWILFNDTPISAFSLENILNECRIHDENSVYKVIEGFNDLIRNKEIVFGPIDYEFNEVVVNERKTGKYLLVNMKKIAEKFKGLVIGAKDKTIKDLIAYINDFRIKRYTMKELKDLQRERKEFGKKY